jgi:hypothetical protein
MGKILKGDKGSYPIIYYPERNKVINKNYLILILRQEVIYTYDKIILAILFFICLADMPYGYYQLVRFAALIGFAILAYTENEQGQKTEAIVYFCLAILFQPLIKIALVRKLWNVVDVIVGIGLITSIFIKRKPIKN